MSTVLVILCVLTGVAVFLTPLVLDLMHENKRLQVLADQSDYFRIACENASDGLLIQDMNATIKWANPAYGRIHGQSPDKLIGRNPLEFALPKDQTPSAADIAAFRYDTNDPEWSDFQLFKNVRADGSEFWNQIGVSFHTAEDGQQSAILVCRDVTEQVEHEYNLRDISLRLEHEASHDGLTGVPNRAAFMTFFETALQSDDRPQVGLLHIDLDKFKQVNDTHGHTAGDAVLVHAAQAVRNRIRPGDMIARVGGDEFVVVCPGLSRMDDLDTLAKDLIAAISEPFDWSNRILMSEASIGAVISSTDPISAEDLLVQADFALYEAKRAGRNQVAIYDDALRRHHAYLNQRSSELIDAVDTDDLEYFFQPTLDLKTGAVTGFETLVRWEHPEDGLIPPDHFLPLAKDLGLMGELDLLSMTAALKEKRRLDLAGYTDLKMAFNASQELLSHPDFINRLIWGVEAGCLNRGDITIEVLETTDFGDPSQPCSHAAIIGDLRSAGFQVHLDDFGVGFAGLSHLAKLDVTGVKIDRGLIKDILSDQISKKIVRKIVELCNDLGLTVIAEGVEDQRTGIMLHDMGCGTIQGYWVSRPLSNTDLYSWLARQSGAQSA